jgi:leucyl aminopeptidase
MKFSISNVPLVESKSDMLAVGIFESEELTEDAKILDHVLGGLFSSLIKETEFKGEAGKTVELQTLGKINARRVCVVGLGKKKGFSLDTIRKASAAAVRCAAQARVKRLTTALFGVGADRVGPNDPSHSVQAVVEGALLGGYQFEKYKTKKEDEKGRVEEVEIAAGKTAAENIKDWVRQGEITGEAVLYARDLINEPANMMTPAKLAQEAEKIAREHKLGCKVLGRREIEKKGMGALLGVARGSSEEPRFIHVSYEPKGAKKKIALVGKGLTFDSGGIDLKPSDKMEKMKYDMSGAAAVLAAIHALAKLKPEVAVHAIIPATENMPSGSALKPGDLLKAMNGKTIEVISTDAEGRLILADALCYAVSLGVDEIIDVATLTGACAVALGKLAYGVIGNDDGMVNAVLRASEVTGEKGWRLPLYEEYKEQLKSEVADIKNLGDREGGALTAALFLQEFVGDRRWVHLDIAGPAWTDVELPYCPKGATGVATRTMINYVMENQQ